jgi:hypothetical protein
MPKSGRRLNDSIRTVRHAPAVGSIGSSAQVSYGLHTLQPVHTVGKLRERRFRNGKVCGVAPEYAEEKNDLHG